MSLQETMGAARRTAQDARDTIMDLVEVARELENDHAARSLSDTAGLVAEDTYALMALGRFNAGKSTLINALLADTRDVEQADRGIVPIGDEATTPTLIRIDYSDEPYVRTRHADGREHELTLEQFRTGYVLDSREDSNTARYGDIVTGQIGLPAELLRQHVTLYDTPGTADSPGRDEITRAALRRCDAAIAVYTMGEYGYHEAETEQLARQEKVQIFTVVNTFGKPVTDERHQSAWNKLVLPYTREEYAGQDLVAHHIHFVDARAALRARAAGDDTAGTGLDALEADLADFLLSERQGQHISRHLAAAVAQSDILRRATAADIEEASRPTRDGVDLAEQLALLEPKLAEIAQRRNRIPRTVSRGRRAAMSEVRTDYHRLMFDIERRLPGVLRAARLPSWRDSFVGSKINALRQQKLVDEVGEAARKFAADEVREWRDTARELVAEQIDELFQEVSTELEEMQDEYADAFAALAGWSPEQVRGDRAVGKGERWAAGLVGAVLGGGGVGAIAAAGGGKKAVAYGVGAQVLTFVGLGLAGATAPVVLPAVVVAGVLAAFVGGSLTRDKLVDSFLAKGMPDLLGEFRRHEREITDEISATFDRLGDELTRHAAAMVSSEERKFATTVALKSKSDEERETELKRLAVLRQRIDDARADLESLDAAAAFQLAVES